MGCYEVSYAITFEMIQLVPQILVDQMQLPRDEGLLESGLRRQVHAQKVASSMELLQQLLDSFVPQAKGWGLNCLTLMDVEARFTILLIQFKEMVVLHGHRTAEVFCEPQDISLQKGTKIEAIRTGALQILHLSQLIFNFLFRKIFELLVCPHQGLFFLFLISLGRIWMILLGLMNFWLLNARWCYLICLRNDIDAPPLAMQERVSYKSFDFIDCMPSLQISIASVS